MALNFLRKKLAGSSADQVGRNQFKRDPHKARAFFGHANAMADARNYDYAIECYINGLRHDPDNIAQHESLHDVALKYKVGGGKPASLSERLKSLGKDHVSRMLDAEKLWCKAPLQLNLMLTFMERAVDADQAEDELNFGEVAFWVGEKVLRHSIGNKKANKATFVRTSELFETIGRFDMAVEACKRALMLDQQNDVLLKRLKDLETEQTMVQGGYSEAVEKEGGFRDVVRDLDKQKALEQDDQITKSASTIDQMIARRRTEYEEDPQDIDRLRKLVTGLRQKGSDEADDEAIKLLNEAWSQTGQYRHKSEIGDVRMAQFKRQLRPLKQQADAGDQEAAKKFKEQRAQKLQFELDEYTERVKNYPTDLKLRFELGRRLQIFKKYDEAIAMFQEAQADPSNRAMSLFALGVCYDQKGWVEESINSLKRGIETHPTTDDSLALDMRYALLNSLEKQAKKAKSAELAREAQQCASEILQTKINYRDIRERLAKIRQLADELTG